MQDLLSQRYGKNAPDLELPEELHLLVSHRTSRSYDGRPVPQEVLEAALVAAQSAPSSSNLQTWSVVAVQDRAKINALNAVAGNQKHIASAPLFLIWLADLSRLDAICQSEGQSGESLDSLEFLLMSTLDTGLAAQNATVAFEAMGLGCCYIGGIRNHADKVAEILGLPPKAYAVVGMTVGYPEQAASIRPRLPLSDVLHLESYRADPLASVPSYNEAMAEFQARQGMKPQNWSAQVALRSSSLEYMAGREHIRAHLLALGFDVK